MIISFFEEFPTTQNLNKIKLIAWPSKLYVAARSVEEFTLLQKEIRNQNINEIIYWPILKKSEGYWVSPFSQQAALHRIFAELKNKNIPVMLDLELPTTQNPFLYLTQSLNFYSNRRIIHHFINRYRGKVYLAEYFLGKRGRNYLGWLGLHYSSPNAQIIPMMYHSMHPLGEQKIRTEFSAAKNLFGEKCIPGFGTIAPGILKIEPILSPQSLKRDLILAQEAGVEEVVIFRLGGLNKEYVRVIQSI